MLTVTARKDTFDSEFDFYQVALEECVRREVKSLVGDNSPLVCAIMKSAVYHLHKCKRRIEEDSL